MAATTKRSSGHLWRQFSHGYQRFLGLVPMVSGTRLFLASTAGILIILSSSSWAHDVVVGYGYGAVVFTIVSWPFVPHLVRHLSWPSHLLIRAVGLLILSILSGSLGEVILGRNPQAAGLRQFNWGIAQKLLWQFPLVLPVENLLLIGILAALWRLVRPRGSWTIILLAITSAFVFGLWHVPFWGWGTLLTIGLTVVPWTLYIIATGDLVVPMATHLLMDGLAMVSNFSPNPLLRHSALVLVVVAAIVWGALSSWWQDLRSATPGSG